MGLALCALALAACGRGQDAPAPAGQGPMDPMGMEDRTPVVSVAAATRQKVARDAVYSATVQANVVNHIAPQTGGRIVKLNVEVGDFVSAGQVLHKLVEMKRKEDKLEEMQERLQNAAAGTPKPHKPTSQAKPKPTNGIIVAGDPGMSVHFSNCCNPLPGDKIVGYITRGRGVSIHRADCRNMPRLSLEPERFVPVEWAASSTEDSPSFFGFFSSLSSAST